MNKIKMALISAAPALFSLTASAYAADITIDQPGMGVTNLGKLISSGIKLAMLIAVLVVFIYLVYGGFQWITSGGEKEGVAAAKAKLTAAIIGLAIIACAWAFILLIENFFGIKIFGQGGFNIPSASGS